MIRVVRRSFAAAVLALALLATPARAADTKCTIATKPETEVGKACASGGRPAAKKDMKEMVKKAKANGQKFTCEGCHKDLDNYALTKNGQEDFKKLVAAQTK
jgi:hypothetical protein